jgi:RNA polymerase-binding transcription factor DksA
MAAKKSKAEAAHVAAKKPIQKAVARKVVSAKGPAVKKQVQKTVASKNPSRPSAAAKTAKLAAVKSSPMQGEDKLVLGKQDRERLKQLLLSIKERLIGQVASLKCDALTREDGVHSAEDGTDAFERQFALSIASSENHDLVEVDEALRRLDDGSYGKCEECACVIVAPRLRALPFVRRCVVCQSKSESSRRHIRVAEEPEET